MLKLRRLLLVHAHPDDEALSTGGTIARYSAEGAHVCLVTCTNGELGEIAEVPELGPLDDVRGRLGQVRATELEEACRRLGAVDLRMLGFHDSGMAGTPANEDAKVFMNQDLDEPVGKIVSIVREVRPQILVTYNDFGFYGHPDHIRAHQAALRAVEAAADPVYAPEAGDPHQVAKVYYTAVPKSLLRTAREMAKDVGWDDADDAFTDEEIERIATDDELITTSVDVSAYIERKFSALEAHRTQLGTTQWVLKMPAEYRVLGFGTEHYVLARSTVDASAERELDLFEGVA
jgi:N-acetyl-1-D-myo-inositol-2-amino-2-deoxy-alpha-D-glucopyranoside deacetylase